MDQHRVTTWSFRELPIATATLAHDRIAKVTMDEKANRQARFDRLQKCPFPQMDSIFVEFPDPYAHGYSGMQIGHVTSPPTFVKKMAVDDAPRKYDCVRRTSHPNLVNLTDMSVTEDGVYLSYKGTGASLADLHPFISGDPITIATICKKILLRLTYIHEDLNISHGNLTCDNVYVSRNSKVQIRDIKKSLIRIRDTADFSHNMEAVYNIATTLLDLSQSASTASTAGLMADQFTKIPARISPQDLLKHPFFRISQDSWYLSHLGALRSFYLQPHTRAATTEAE